MKKALTTRHDEHLASLARIAGQINGIRNMIERGEYCVDIIMQIRAVQAALKSVSQKILKKHMHSCVTSAFRSKYRSGARAKIDELMKIFDSRQ